MIKHTQETNNPSCAHQGEERIGLLAATDIHELCDFVTATISDTVIGRVYTFHPQTESERMQMRSSIFMHTFNAFTTLTHSRTHALTHVATEHLHSLRIVGTHLICDLQKSVGYHTSTWDVTAIHKTARKERFVGRAHTHNSPAYHRTS